MKKWIVLLTAMLLCITLLPLGAMAQQHQRVAPLLRMQRQVGDEGKPFIVGGHQAGQRVLAHQGAGMGRVV